MEILVAMSQKLNISETLETLAQVLEPRGTQSKIAKAFGVSQKTVQNVIMHANILRASVARESGNQRVKLTVNERFTVIKEVIHRWYDGCRRKIMQFL